VPHNTVDRSVIRCCDGESLNTDSCHFLRMQLFNSADEIPLPAVLYRWSFSCVVS